MPAFAASDDIDVSLVLENAARRRKYNVSSANALRKRHGLPTCHKLRFTDTDNQTPDAGGGTTPEPRSPISRSATPSSKSFRATNRLARRARSFKEDFLEKISQMRNTATAPIGTTTPTTLVDSSGLNNRLGGRETPTLVDGGGDDEKVVMMLGGRRSPTVKKGSGDKMGGIGSGVDKGPVHEFDMLTKQLQTALMYFRSLVANDKLEMLAGNGTIILDTVWAINLAVKSSCAAGIQSNTDMSWKIKEATQAMYHNASRLIKVCDDALINQDDVDEKKKDLKKDDEETKAKMNLYRASVEKVLATLEDSVKFLLNIARDSLTPPPPNNLNHYKTTPNNNHHHHHRNSTNCNLIDSAHQHSGSQQQLLLRPPSPSPNAPAQQRNSLPDIPLTPRERELLNEKQNRHSSSEENGGCEGGGEGNGDCVDGRGRLGKNSFSSESVLKDVELGGAVPPPKPPLPQSLALRSLLMGNCASPPPLPPKKNKSGKYGLENMAYIDQISYNLERSSLRSRSPEDSISLLSASAGSLDSMLNHSREEEEIKSIMDHTDSDTVLENDISDAFVASHHHTTVTSSSSHNSTSSHQVTHQSCGNRLSNTDSGVVSMHSLRNSSCSKRSSVTSSSSNAIKHVEVSNNESIVRTSSVETESTSQISHQTYCGSQITSSVTSSTVNSSNSSNSSSTVSMLSSNNNNHVQHNMQHCRLDSTATTAEDDDEYDFKNMGSVDFEDDVILQGGDKERSANSGGDVPPVLPQKMRKNVGIKERMPSPYDNVTDISNHKSGEFIVTCQMHQSHQSLSSSVSIGSSISQDNGKPPPLPPKKKHMFQSVAYSVMAYMEMFGNCSHANDEFMRHSVHMMHGNWAASGPGGGGADGQQAMSSTQSCSFSSQNTWRTQSLALHQLSMDANPSLPSNNHSLYSHHSYNHAPPLSKSPLPHPHFTSTPTSASKLPLTSQASNPPALPPKRLRTPSTLVTPPPSPPPPSQLGPTQHITTITESGTGTTGTTAQHASNTMSDDVPTLGDCSGLTAHGQVIAQLPDLLEHTTAVAGGAGGNKQQLQDPNATTAAGSVTSGTDEKWRSDLMEATDIDDYLVLKKADEDMPDIRGGSVDALIIQASMATRNSGFSYQEAFLTTYRTFITPCELITKLIRRYYFFYRQTDKKKRFREAFALIVCVVNDLVSSDLDTLLHQMLMDFDQSLIADGELVLAKALRIKLLEKHDNKLHKLQQSKQILSNQNAANNNAPTMSPNVATPTNKGAQTLLDFKSEQIAEQMTLLDAELFMRIEIPEVLIWVQEQKEETSPNLTRFTEHFNKMSYWARTRILLADARDRERYFVKFIKIMKQLRKINNFNSYLALLSALDSAPVRRLEWQKHVQDGLKEYCALIDSSSSFRAYRQALAETSPPCIPYIGLVLQDLTFVHIGNSNLLSNGAINFSKRWQQFHIVENMKRFKKCSYSFKRNDRIISYFQNFNDHINEDEMWNLSENIKPRGRKAVQ